MRLVFVHIPHTGGTSIHRAFSRRVSFFHGHNPEVISSLEGWDIIGGHWKLSQLKNRCEGVEAFTIVREPGDWWLARYIKAKKLLWRREEKGLSMEEFFDRRVADEALLARLDNDIERFSHIGDLGSLETTARWLESFFGLSPASLPVTNNTKADYRPLSPQTEEIFKRRVREKCPKDCAAYNQIKQSDAYLRR